MKMQKLYVSIPATGEYEPVPAGKTYERFYRRTPILLFQKRLKSYDFSRFCWLAKDFSGEGAPIHSRKTCLAEAGNLLSGVFCKTNFKSKCLSDFCYITWLGQTDHASSNANHALPGATVPRYIRIGTNQT